MQPSNNTPPPVQDFTTPAAMLAAAIVSVGMIAAVVFGPRPLGEQLTPILLTLLTVLGSAFGVILTRQGNALHTLVNSRVDQFEKKSTENQAEAARQALLLSDERVKAAEAAAEARGIEAGKALAVEALVITAAAEAATPAPEPPQGGGLL